MPIIENTEYNAEALALLLEQYKGKENIEDLLSSYMEQVQLIEGPVYDLWFKRLLDNATAAQLDLLGEVVKQERVSADDDIYRAFITARISINRSNGRAEELLNILALVSEPTEKFEIRDLGNASILIETHTPQTAAWIDTLLALMVDAKSAGVKIQFLWTEELDTLIFEFADGDSKLYKLIPNAADNFHFIIQTPYVPMISGTQYVCRIRAKADEYDHIRLQGNSAAFPTGPVAVFDLTTGTLDSTGGTDSTAITDEGGGIYLLDMRMTANASVANAFWFAVSDASDPTFRGNGSDGVLVRNAWLSVVGSSQNLFQKPDTLDHPLWDRSRLYDVAGVQSMGTDVLKGYSNAAQDTGGYMAGVKGP